MASGSLSVIVDIRADAALSMLSTSSFENAVEQATKKAGKEIETRAVKLANDLIYSHGPFSPSGYHRTHDYDRSLHIGDKNNFYKLVKRGANWVLTYGSRMRYASLVEAGASNAAEGKGKIIQNATKFAAPVIFNVYLNQIQLSLRQRVGRVGGRFASLDDLFAQFEG